MSRSGQPSDGSPRKHRAQREGVDAEAFVAAWLEDEGYTVLARNWSGAGAELDLIVVRDGVVRFVEVKARQPGDDTALEAIGAEKQRRLRRAATSWIERAGNDTYDEYAFLVAVVTLERGMWRLDTLDDAF